MCPECNSENTRWLRGAVLAGARDCLACGITYDDTEIFTEQDVFELKDNDRYSEIHLSNKVPGVLIIYGNG